MINHVEHIDLSILTISVKYLWCNSLNNIVVKSLRKNTSSSLLLAVVHLFRIRNCYSEFKLNKDILLKLDSTLLDYSRWRFCVLAQMTLKYA